MVLAQPPRGILGHSATVEKTELLVVHPGYQNKALTSRPWAVQLVICLHKREPDGFRGHFQDAEAPAVAAADRA